jgi:hypothetical protein
VPFCIYAFAAPVVKEESLPGDRDNWGGKAFTTFEGSALAIYGYALGEAFKAQILPSIAYYLVPLVGESDALAIAGAIVATGEIAGALSVGFAGGVILGAVGLMAVAAAGGKSSDISSGFDVLGMITPGTVFSMPIGLALSPADDPTLVSRVGGPGIDLALGVLTAGNPELLKVAGIGYGITATQSDYQVDEANLQNWVSSLTNGSAGSLPRPSPTPGPTPTPTPGPSSTFPQSFGSQGYVFPFDGSALGSGDLGYESDEGSSYSYSSSSSFNGNGFNMTMTINSSGASEAPSEPPFNDAPPFDDGSPFNDAPPFDNHPFNDGGFNDGGFNDGGFDDGGFDD